MDKSKKMRVAVTVIATLMIIAGLGISFAISEPGHGMYVGMPAVSSISSSIGQSINVTFSRVSYINEPTQWIVSPGTPQTGAYQAAGAWVLNNSGYFIMQQNASSPAKPTYVDYNYSADTGSLAYYYMNSRIALNGSANAYIVIAEKNITALPGTTGAIKASAGKAQNQLNVNFTHVTGGYNITVGYFALNSKGYENYTAVTMTHAKTLLPLVFYEVTVYATATKTSVYLEDTMTGSVLSNVSFNATVNGNLSKLNNTAYEVDSSGAMILSFADYLNHNTYASSTSPAILGNMPFVAQTNPSMTLPFDPSSTNTSYTQGPTATSDYRGATGNLNSFSNVIGAQTSQAAESSLINTSRSVQSTIPLATYGADNVTNTLRTTNTSGLSFSASVHVDSWNTSAIHDALVNYLQGYIYQADPNAFPDGVQQVDVTYYIITSISVNLQFGSRTATSIQNSIDNALPGVLTNHHLSIVDSATAAIAAGEYAGEFQGAGVMSSDSSYGNVPVAMPAIVHGSTIVNPFTMVSYPSLQDAGFPEGSYISNGQVVVPQVTFYGFSSTGQPEFSAAITTSTPTGAALAVQGYLHSAIGTVYNAQGVSSVPSTPYTMQAQIGASSHAITGFAQDTLKTAQNYLPFIGATVANIGASVSSSLGSTTLGNTGHALLSTTSQTVGALLAGADSSSTYVYRIGAAMSQQPKAFYSNASAYNAAIPGATPDFNLFGAINNAISNTANSVYTTATNAGSTFVNDAQAVVSPVYTTVQNLGTTAVNDVKAAANTTLSTTEAYAKPLWHTISGSLAAGQSALNTIGNAVTVGASKALTLIQGTAGKISSYISGAAGYLSNGIHGIFSWVTGIFGSVVSFLSKYILYIVGGIIGIIALVGIVLWKTRSSSAGMFTKISASEISRSSRVPARAILARPYVG